MLTARTAIFVEYTIPSGLIEEKHEADCIRATTESYAIDLKPNSIHAKEIMADGRCQSVDNHFGFDTNRGYHALVKIIGFLLVENFLIIIYSLIKHNSNHLENVMLINLLFSIIIAKCGMDLDTIVHFALQLSLFQ